MCLGSRCYFNAAVTDIGTNHQYIMLIGVKVERLVYVRSTLLKGILHSQRKSLF